MDEFKLEYTNDVDFSEELAELNLQENDFSAWDKDISTGLADPDGGDA